MFSAGTGFFEHEDGVSFVRFVYKVLWIYSFFTLALLSAVALVPTFLLVHWAATRALLFGIAIQGPDAGVAGDLLRAFLVSFSLTLGYFLFGLSLMLVMVAMRFAMRLRSKEDVIPIPSLKLWTWYHYDGLLLFYSLVFAPMLRGMSLFNVYLRLMGAKVGPGVVVNTSKVYDHDLLEIGENTIIGGDAIIIGHVADGPRLVRKRVRIGKNVLIGQLASVFPGAIIGDDAVVGAHSLVLKDTVIPPGTIWGGVPARQIGVRKSSS